MMSMFTNYYFYVNIDVTLDVFVDIKTLECKHWCHLKSILKNWILLLKAQVSYSEYMEFTGMQARFSLGYTLVNHEVLAQAGFKAP